MSGMCSAGRLESWAVGRGLGVTTSRDPKGAMEVCNWAQLFFEYPSSQHLNSLFQVAPMRTSMRFKGRWKGVRSEK